MEQTINKATEVNTAPILKEFLNPSEVSKEFGFSVSTLAKWRMKNLHLAYSKVGNYIKYKRGDIVKFLEARTIKAVA